MSLSSVTTRGYRRSASAVATRGYGIVSVVVVPVAPVDIASIAGLGDYEFFVRDPRTLAFVGELHPADVVGSWTRRNTSGGSFQLTLPRDRYPRSLLAKHAIIEVRRFGQQEFVGYLERLAVDKFAKQWTLSGPDALGFWLRKRQVGVITADTRSGVAQDVLTAYLEAYTGAAAPHPVGTELSVPWAIQASSGLGASVNIQGQRRSLEQIAQEICVAGDLVMRVEMDPDAGFTFVSEAPVDATQASGALPFAVDLDNVEQLVFTEDYSEFYNDLYVMGDGSGDTRNYLEVIDADSVVTDFRRELVVDARYATTAAARQQVGDYEQQRRQQAIVTVTGKPLRASGQAVYRGDWDVGWLVTFADSDLREEPIDERIVAATVSLSVERGEDVTMEIGAPAPTSQMRRIAQAIAELRVASFG